MMLHRKKRHPSFTQSTDQISPLVQLWSLRLLVLADGHRKFIEGDGSFADTALAQAIGLFDYLDQSGEDPLNLDRRQSLRHIKALHEKIENLPGKSLENPVLQANLRCLQDMAGLTEVDCRILSFALLVHTDMTLESAADCLDIVTIGKMVQVLAMLLDLSVKDVQAGFSIEGRLERSGILRLDRDLKRSLKHRLDFLSEGFASHMLLEEMDPVAMISDVIQLAPSPQLSLSDFQHLKPHLDILCPYLHRAVEAARAGVNILLYGPPGTGKSELSRVIARNLGCQLFEIASVNELNRPAGGYDRMKLYRAAQNFLCQQQAVIVFDEVEDLFGNGNSFNRKNTGQEHKAWINRILEENTIPTFWIANTPYGLDPAYIRRFDLILEIPIPPKAQRMKILEQAGGDLLDGDSMNRIVMAEHIPPAVVTRACSVIRTIRDEMPRENLPRSVELLITGTLQAQGHLRLLENVDAPSSCYDINLVNADIDLDNLAAGLNRGREARLCLFGPSGTGKTAFGKWLADRLEMPLLVRKASDILNPYVGLSEKNIASAFRQAKEDGALLLIDEVDSFLRDRRGADHSWEVTLVNEMLTQMEAFPGIFIASTNLMTGIDQAALRRFDLKICFDYLRGTQAWRLFRRQCEIFGNERPIDHLERPLKGLKTLTLGDFAAVKRQQRFRKVNTPDALFEALAAECALKEERGGRNIGFL